MNRIRRARNSKSSVESLRDRPRGIKLLSFGNTYGLVPGSAQVAFLARQTLTVNWVPPAPGYYAISVEVAPSDDFTILTGRGEAVVSVR